MRQSRVRPGKGRRDPAPAAAASSSYYHGTEYRIFGQCFTRPDIVKAQGVWPSCGPRPSLGVLVVLENFVFFLK